MEEVGREKDRAVVVAMENFSAATKDTANIKTKPTRRYPLASWIAILALTMLVGVYISSLSLKQNGMLFGLKQTNMIEKEREKPCHDPSTIETEIPYVHYPTPDTYSRKECACTPVTFFAILSMQRSGSGWFETLLNSHENISSNGEIFSVKERRSNITSIIKTLDKLYNLDWFSSAAKNECTAAVGLKWMLNQGLMKHHEEIIEYFNRRGVSAIFLLRRNLLQRYVSILANAHDSATKQLNGTHKAHVHSRDEADVLAEYKPSIDTNLLIAELKWSDKLAADALVNFKKTRNIILYYEDVVSNRTKLMDVLDFLKLPKIKLSSRHVKIHTKRLRDHINNWVDVNNTLKGTQYESFLNGQSCPWEDRSPLPRAVISLGCADPLSSLSDHHRPCLSIAVLSLLRWLVIASSPAIAGLSLPAVVIFGSSSDVIALRGSAWPCALSRCSEAAVVCSALPRVSASPSSADGLSSQIRAPPPFSGRRCLRCPRRGASGSPSVAHVPTARALLSFLDSFLSVSWTSLSTVDGVVSFLLKKGKPLLASFFSSMCAKWKKLLRQ